MRSHSASDGILLSHSFKSEESQVLGFSARALCMLLSLCLPALATTHIDFTYPDRATFLAAGWGFTAQSVAGATRNTEQTSGAVVSYDQIAHPGVLRVPVSSGDLWGGANNTKNSIFHGLPSNWSSLRLKLSFAPSSNYQEAGLTVYQDDDNYVQVIRDFSGGNEVSFNWEQNGTPITLTSIKVSQTSLYLRLNRDVGSETISGFYSLDGTNWIQAGSVVQHLINPQMAVTSGGSNGGLPNADLSWVEIDVDPNYLPTYLNVYPTEVLFKMTAGGPAPVSQTVNILSSTPGTVVNWSQTTSAPWLQASPPSGTTPGTVTVSVNPAGLAPGVYTGNVNVSPNISGGATAAIPVTFVVNPNIPVSAVMWRDGKAGAMSFVVDDGNNSCFSQLTQAGLTGTYVANGYTAPSFYTQYYNAGMEVGAHLAVHVCSAVSDDLLTQYITLNVPGLCQPNTPASCSSITSLAWPCGFTNVGEERISNQYFVSTRGYNFNQLEETTPTDFQNLKSYNSHEHTPYPPADLKTVVDAAQQQGKWGILVFHTMCNDDGAIAYTATQNVWAAPVGTIIKYILQRDRVVFTNYQGTSQSVSFSVTRVNIPAKTFMNVEGNITSSDTVTLKVNLAAGSQVSSVLVNGVSVPYQAQIAGSGVAVYFSALVNTSPKTVQVLYSGGGKSLSAITVTPANSSVAKGLTQAFIATGIYTDNSTQDLTASVTWSSSNTAAATITSGGLATGASVGSTTIKATLGSVSGSTVLTITAPQLVSLAVTPANGSVSVNGTQAYTATGTYTDTSTQNLTASVTWSSSNTAAATITTAGVATGVAVGSTTIQANLGVIGGSTGLTVTATLTGLAGYWAFDEGTGTTASDSSGGGHPATLVGPTWVTGKIADAVSADGVSGYVSVPSIDLSGTKAVTVALWVNRTYSGTGDHILVEASPNYNNSTTGFMLLLDDSTCGGIQAAINGDAGYSVNCFSQPTSGVWHHLAMVFDKSQPGTSEASLYIDGVLQTPTRNLNTGNNTNNFGNNPIYLFSRAGTGFFTAGMADDLRIYNRALTGAEVQQLYTLGSQ